MGNRWLDLTVEVALANPIKSLPRMAAILVMKNVATVSGMNRLKTHPLQARFSRRPGSIYLHAEVDAIVNAVRGGYGEDIPGGTLYVARVLKNGQPALAKPCPGCQRAIMHFGIANVEWTT